MDILRKLGISTVALLSLLNPHSANIAGNLGGGSGTLEQLPQFVSTSSPSSAITQQLYGKSFRLSGQSAGCGQFSSNGTLTSSGSSCGGSASLSAFRYVHLLPGVTGSGTSVDPYVGFDSALEASTGGEKWYFIDGYFQTDGTELDIAHDNVVLEGASRGAILRSTHSTAGKAIVRFAASGSGDMFGVGLRHMTLDGNGVTKYNLFADNTLSSYFQDIEFRNATDWGFIGTRGISNTYADWNMWASRMTHVTSNGFWFSSNASAVVDRATTVSNMTNLYVSGLGGASIGVKIGDKYTATITNASPAVVTVTAHGGVTGEPLHFTTTGALPTGIVANTIYYMRKIDADTFNIYDTAAHATAGGSTGRINTSSAGSGVHTMTFNDVTQAAFGNVFVGGAFEGVGNNLWIVTDGSYANIFDGVDFEASTGIGMTIAGTKNYFRGINAPGTPLTITGDNNVFEGGVMNFPTDTSPLGNQFINTNHDAGNWLGVGTVGSSTLVTQNGMFKSGAHSLVQTIESHSGDPSGYEIYTAGHRFGDFITGADATYLIDSGGLSNYLEATLDANYALKFVGRAVTFGTTPNIPSISLGRNITTDTNDGLYWNTPYGSGDPYGIYRTAGGWTDPYQQIKVDWPTGIILDPGTFYGKSFVEIVEGGLHVTAGNVGLGTSTPGTLLSLGNTDANTINISPTATSTFGSGINIKTGCFAIAGTCVGAGGGSGTVNSGTFGQLAFYGANGTAVSGTSSIVVGTTTADANNVGIGTTSPFATLSVNAAAGATSFAIGSSTGTNFIVGKNGNIGIGTTTPGFTSLQVDKHDTNAALIISGQGALGGADPTNGVGFYLTFNSPSNRQFVIGDSVTQSGIRYSNNHLDGYLAGARGDLFVGNETNGFHTGFNIATANAFSSISNRSGSIQSKDVFVVEGASVSSDGSAQTGNLISSQLFGETTGAKFVLTGTGLVGIGTSSPYANLSVQSGASTGDAFVVATSSGKTIGGYDNDGHRFSSGPAPAISSCGTGTGTVNGDDQGGTITTATAATSCTLTFAKAYRGNGLYCNVTDDSLVGFADISSTSTTAVTFGISSALTGGHLYYQCAYHK